MKKILCFLLLFALIFSAFLTSCTSDAEPLRIGVLSGPTGMGMAKLISDNKEKGTYQFEMYTDPKSVVSDLAAGDIDIACLPTNTAAALSLSKDNYVQVLAINCLGSLFLLSDGTNTISSLSDLSGKTVVTSVPSSTTKPILSYLLSKESVQVTWEEEPDHPSLVARMAEGADHASLVVLPEPYVTKALAAYPSYSIALNLSQVWSDTTEGSLTMGCIVCKTDTLTQRKKTVDRFLNEYKTSVSYIGSGNATDAASMIADAGILPNTAMASHALQHLSESLVYIDGKQMKKNLISFYTAIGQTLPKDDFYYEK